MGEQLTMIEDNEWYYAIDHAGLVVAKFTELEDIRMYINYKAEQDD